MELLAEVIASIFSDSRRAGFADRGGCLCGVGYSRTEGDDEAVAASDAGACGRWLFSYGYPRGMDQFIGVSGASRGISGAACIDFGYSPGGVCFVSVVVSDCHQPSTGLRGSPAALWFAYFFGVAFALTRFSFGR